MLAGFREKSGSAWVMRVRVSAGLVTLWGLRLKSGCAWGMRVWGCWR
jgi:hypothetical protein